jgi:hypothetical protein
LHRLFFHGTFPGRTPGIGRECDSASVRRGGKAARGESVAQESPEELHQDQDQQVLDAVAEIGPFRQEATGSVAKGVVE